MSTAWPSWPPTWPRCRPAAFVDTLLERTEAVAGQYGGLADDVAIVHLRWKAPW